HKATGGPVPVCPEVLGGTGPLALGARIKAIQTQPRGNGSTGDELGGAASVDVQRPGFLPGAAGACGRPLPSLPLVPGDDPGPVSGGPLRVRVPIDIALLDREHRGTGPIHLPELPIAAARFPSAYPQGSSPGSLRPRLRTFDDCASVVLQTWS